MWLPKQHYFPIAQGLRLLPDSEAPVGVQRGAWLLHLPTSNWAPGLGHVGLSQGLWHTPLLRTLLHTDTHQMFKMDRCSPKALSVPQVDQDSSSCHSCHSHLLAPFRHLISSLVMFQSPRETGSSPVCQPQKEQTIAPPCSSCRPWPPCSSEQPLPCHSGSGQQKD